MLCLVFVIIVIVVVVGVVVVLVVVVCQRLNNDSRQLEWDKVVMIM